MDTYDPDAAIPKSYREVITVKTDELLRELTYLKECIGSCTFPYVRFAGQELLDFKDNTVTLAQPSVGHMIYRMSDVSTAAYHACRSQSRTEEEKERLFYKALAGKALQTIPWEEKSKDNENT